MNTIKKNSGKIIAFCFCMAITVIWLMPIVFSVFTSLKAEVELQTNGYSLLPKNFTLVNYQDLFKRGSTTPILRWFLNTTFAASVHTVLVLAIASTSAFAYSRLKFKGRDQLFLVLMATMMFPIIVTMIPLYKICSILNLIDTPWAVILPGVSGVFNIFLIRQFMLGIPKELDEAAMIDGANKFQIYSQIIMPLCLPVLTVVAMFSFTAVWNDFIWSSLVINNIDKFMITPGMRLVKGTYNTYHAHAMAGGVVSIIPSFIFFIFAQKYFLKGMQLSSGVKG